MTLASGITKDDVSQTFQVSHGSHGTFYFDTMVDHNVIIQATPLTNKAALKDHFPNSKATGTVTVPSTNIKIRYTNIDMEDALASELVSLLRRMPTPQDASAPAIAGISSSVGGGVGVMNSNSEMDHGLGLKSGKKSNTLGASLCTATQYPVPLLHGIQDRLRWQCLPCADHPLRPR